MSLCLCVCVGVHVYLRLCVSFQFELRFKFLFPAALKSRQRFLYAASFVSLNHRTHSCVCVSHSLTPCCSHLHTAA